MSLHGLHGGGGSGSNAVSTVKNDYAYCARSPTWNPTRYATDLELLDRVAARLSKDDDFYGAIAESFSLPPAGPATTTNTKTKGRNSSNNSSSGGGGDTYVYHAIISITLAQAQHAVSLGGADNLHAWYRDAPSPSSASSSTSASTSIEKEAPPPQPHPNPPSPADVDAYLSIFDPFTATGAALRSFAANARKDSVRRRVAEYLLAKRFLHPALLPGLEIPRVKKPKKKNNPNNDDNTTDTPTTTPTTTTTTTTKDNPHPPPNPYYIFASWAARNLEWAGPCDLSEGAPGGGHRGHPVLPILMHHFGCVCPSYEALEVLRVLAAGREVVDAGSGNGYWTFMLRQHGVRCVPVDSMQSRWRANWVSDTVVADAAEWLGRQRGPAGGGGDQVLLVVYPIVGGGVAGGEEGGFTRGLIQAYRGDTLAVVGTQNRNGYTGFVGRSMDEYMAAEEPEWVKVVQVSLPSFPGKDDALFVFQRGARAAKLRTEEGVGE